MTNPQTTPPEETDTADWLDALLYKARPQPLADDGFTTRLMEKIPQPTTQALSERRAELQHIHGRGFYLYTLIGTIVGSVIAIATTSFAEWESLMEGILVTLSLGQFATGALAPLLAAVGNAALLAYLFLESERT